MMPFTSADASLPVPAARTILAIGAHYDDCPFGLPGILLQAVARQQRVVALNIIGDYSGWGPVRGRADQLIDLSVELARERGIEMRFLNYASMQFAATTEVSRAVAEVVAEVQPDIALILWHQDHHPDHEVAAAISKMALRQPGMLLGRDDLRPVERIYAYDNGPSHTIGFEPNVFIDVTAQWPAALAWLSQLMAFVHPQAPERAQQIKETLARYRGMTVGVAYAEALRAIGNYPQELM